MKNNTIKDYFQNEMQILNDGLVDFAQDHPELAVKYQIDAQHDKNPHIDRLLEGFSYLNARVKQQIDLGVAHVAEAMLRQLSPDFLSPCPSHTIIHFSAKDDRVDQAQFIPKGTKLYSEPVGEEKTVCQFATTQPLKLLPIKIINTSSKSLKEGNQSLMLTFEFIDTVNLSDFDHWELEIYLDLPLNMAQQWRHLLLNKVEKILYKTDDSQEESTDLYQCISSAYSKEHFIDSMAENQKNTSFQSLLDYFLFPQKYNFIKLDLSCFSIQQHRFTIEIQCADSIETIREYKDFIKLHCAPASNIFHTSSEPIRYHEKQLTYPLVIDRTHPKSKQLLDICDVKAMNKQSLKTTRLSDFHRHQAKAKGYYRLIQSNHSEQQVYNELVFSQLETATSQISCEVFAHNGHYPNQYLAKESLKLSDDRVSLLTEGTNILRPSGCYQPLFSHNYLMKLLSLANISIDGLKEKEYFKDILGICDKSHKHSIQIDSIQSLGLHYFNRIERGVLCSGVEFHITINPLGFSSKAQINLFGYALHHFLLSIKPLNLSLRSKLEMIPSGELMQWTA